MCGIAGCVGHHEAVGFVTGRLGRMEERGYDSAGIAYPGIEIPQIEVIKAVGGVANLIAEIPPSAEEQTTALGHTRWATHGKTSIENAHPLTNSDGTIAVVHNGVIENHRQLKRDLSEEGYKFISETDTEVVPHLLDFYLRQGLAPEEAFTKTTRRLRGANAILGYFGIEPDAIYASNLKGNLVLGVYAEERFVASDATFLLPDIRYQTDLNDYEIAKLTPDKPRYKTWRFDGKETTRAPKEISTKFEAADKGDFEHWMLKEIYDAPQTVRDATRGRVVPEKGIIKLGGLERSEVEALLKRAERFALVACGTSRHAGLIGAMLIEDIAGIPAEAHWASEFQYQKKPLDYKTAVIAISQSGKTADTLGALAKAHELGLLRLGINNSPGSAMDNATDAGVHSRAGEEKSVASTKAFISQVTVLIEMALAFSRERGGMHQQIMEELVVLPEKLEQILSNAESIKAVAEKYADFKHFLYIGRGYEAVSAMEGALKLKEISYIHAEAYPSGEMKHGPIALIDEGFPTFAVATDSPVYDKTVSNISEIKARGGPVIALATTGNEAIRGEVDDVIYVPGSLEQTQPILNAVAMQLFAYYVAIKRGVNVDRPRNLAKSVTVE